MQEKEDTYNDNISAKENINDLSNNSIDIDVKKNINQKSKDIPLRVKQKKELVNYILNGIENSKMPNNVWLLIIKSIHITTPGYCLIIFLLGSFELSMVFLTLLNITLLLFLYFNGCFLTTIENKLEKDSVNIIDPYIYLMNDIPNKNNRFYYTLQLSFFYFLVAAFILYYRHFNKLNNLSFFDNFSFFNDLSFF